MVETSTAEDVLGGAGVDDGGIAVELLRAMVEESAGELVDGEAATKSKVHYEFKYYMLDLPNCTATRGIS